jgi:urease accessory protein
LLLCDSAWAGEVAYGTTPLTVAQGLFNGFAHPISELEHLGVLVGVGVIAVMFDTARIPLAFIVATLAGVRLHGFGLRLPECELLMAVSVLACGVVLAVAPSRAEQLLASGVVIGGLVHGFDYGAPIVAAPLAAFLATLAALTLTQIALITSVYCVGRWYVWSMPRGTNDLFVRAGAYMLFAGMVAVVLAMPA